MRIKENILKIKENKEIRSYIVWGVASSILNIGLFHLLTEVGLDYRISNIIALLINRVFCYLTNKLFVFKTKTGSFFALVKEIVSFLVARLVTFIIDYYCVIFLVEILKLALLISKIITAILVIICNYIFSKVFVFKKQREIA